MVVSLYWRCPHRGRRQDNSNAEDVSNSGHSLRLNRRVIRIRAEPDTHLLFLVFLSITQLQQWYLALVQSRERKNQRTTQTMTTPSVSHHHSQRWRPGVSHGLLILWTLQQSVQHLHTHRHQAQPRFPFPLQTKTLQFRFTGRSASQSARTPSQGIAAGPLDP